MSTTFSLRSVASVLLVLSFAFLLTSCGETESTSGDNNATTAAVIKGDTTELQNAMTEVTYFKAKAKMEVTKATLNFAPEGPILSDPSEDGNQFVRVELQFTNEGEEPFKMFYTNVSMDTSKESGVSQTFLINKSNAGDFLESKELAQGETASGALYFEVPAEETLETLAVSYKGYDGETKQYKVALQ